MASGGIYDHIGGGFARYSTDRQWLVPHFEKMLYDQALLGGSTCTRSRCSARTGGSRSPARPSTTSCATCAPLGGFFSAEDADSPDEHGHGHEGLFHTWTPRRCGGAVEDPVVAARAGGMVRHHALGQLRGPVDPQPDPAPRGVAPAPADRDRAPGDVRRAGAAAPARPRRQGVHRVERAVPVHALRGGGGHRASGLARRRRAQRRVPAREPPP
jgi:uncharacterized protein